MHVLNKTYTYTSLFLALLLIWTLSSCGDDEETGVDNQEQIAQYLIDSNLTAMKTSSGLHIIIEEEGDENKPMANSSIKMDYIGSYLDGVEFDNSYDRGTPLTINKSDLILGVSEGLEHFGIGGKGKLIIPSNLGYGSSPNNGIRDNAVLIFDLELLDVDRIIATEEQRIKEEADIEAFINENNLSPFVTPEGVYIIFEDEGESEKPSVSDNITIHYRGTFLNGNQFDSSYDRGTPLRSVLNNLIEGWKIAIPYFGRGGKGRLIIPSTLAYGNTGSTGIPPNTTLVFDIELIDF